MADRAGPIPPTQGGARRGLGAFLGLVRRWLVVGFLGCVLHADTLEETRDQLCRENGVVRAHLDAVTLKVYLQVKRTVGWSIRRWVGCVYESDGRVDRLLWTKEGGGTFVRHQLLESAVVSQEQEEEYAEFLAGLLRQGVRHIDDVRRALVKGERMEGWKNARLGSR